VMGRIKAAVRHPLPHAEAGGPARQVLPAG
jgi:hypothetical protein